MYVVLGDERVAVPPDVYGAVDSGAKIKAFIADEAAKRGVPNPDEEAEKSTAADREAAAKK